MPLTEEQERWLTDFTLVDAAQTAFEQEQALKQRVLADVRKRVAAQRDALRAAMTFTVEVDGKELGDMLADQGTQLDEVDFTEIRAGGLKLSKERTSMIQKASAVLIQINEDMKAETVVRKGQRVPLFEPAEIAAELWTPLVRERLMPETLVGDVYSDTQKMLDETNKLYAAAIAAKEEAGELTGQTDRVSSMLDLGSRAALIGADVAGALGGRNAAMAKAGLGLVSAAMSGGDEVYKAVRDSGFPDAMNTLTDNVGLVLDKVIQMATGDPALAKTITSAYKAAASLTKAGVAFSKGVEGMNDGLGALADAFGAAFDAGDPKGDNPAVQQAKNALVSAFKGGQAATKIGKALMNGDAAGVIDGLTDLTKATVAAGFRGQAIQQAAVSTKPGEREQIAKDTEAKLANIDEAIDWGKEGLKTAVRVVDAARRGQITDAVDALLQGIGQNLGAALERGGVPAETANIVANSYGALVKGQQVIALMVQDPPKTKEAIGVLSEGVAKVFAAAAPADDLAVADAGSAVAMLFESAATAIDVKKDWDAGKYEDAAKKLAMQAGKAVMKVLARMDVVPASTASDGPEDPESTVAMAKVVLANVGQLKNGLAALKALDAAQAQGNIDKEQVAGALAEVEAKDKELADTLALLRTGGDPGKAAAAASSIEKLIVQMERDRMIIDMAFKISQGGAAVVQKLVPAVGIAGAALAMAANILSAAKRAQALNAWMRNKQDFAMAQSALTSSAKKFVTQQRDQFSHYAIQAALEAARLIAEIGKVSGMGAPIAAAIDAAATAGKALEEVIKKTYDEQVLEAAWKVTAAAFANPQNRKLGLAAREQNPTLSKYTIAWGAVAKNDPLAKNAMASCGLTETTLADKDSNVDNVVKYLEVFFRDDDKLYRKLEDSAAWLPADLQLDNRSWTKLKAAAVKHIALKNSQTPRIDALMTKMSAMARLANTDPAELATELGADGLTELVPLTEELARALRAWEPESDSKEGRDALLQALARLAAEARGLSASARSRRDALVKSQQKATTGA